MSYKSEKLNAARNALMLPHSNGEAKSVANAFHEISLAFDFTQPDKENLNDDARECFRRLKEFMDTSDLTDPQSEGRWIVKARTFDTDDKIIISRCVDELANWFSRTP